MEALPAKKDEKTKTDQPSLIKTREAGLINGDFDYVVCNYEKLDAERLSSCIHDIIGSSRALRQSHKGIVTAGDGDYGDTISEQEVKQKGDFFNLENEELRENPVQLRGLASLGHRIHVSKSLQDYLEEAKRKHLPPTKNTGNGSGFGLNSIGETGQSIFLLKTADNGGGSLILQTGSDASNRSARIVDLKISPKNYPDMSTPENQEDWSLIEDILAIDMSSHAWHKSPCVENDKRTGASGRTHSSKWNKRTTTEEKRTDSVPKEISRKGEQKSFERVVFYDKSDIELMDDIEKQFLK